MFFAAASMLASAAMSQPKSGYDPHKSFDPNFDANGGTVYRGANGAPDGVLAEPRRLQNSSYPGHRRQKDQRKGRDRLHEQQPAPIVICLAPG